MLPRVAEEFYLVDDPELRFSPNGKAVARLRLKASSRKKDGDQWVDDHVLWISATAFGELAEHATESLQKGDLVLVIGRIKTEQWETKEGEKRSAIVLLADHVGPSLRFRITRHGSGSETTSSTSSAEDNEPPF